MRVEITLTETATLELTEEDFQDLRDNSTPGMHAEWSDGKFVFMDHPTTREVAGEAASCLHYQMVGAEDFDGRMTWEEEA